MAKNTTQPPMGPQDPFALLREIKKATDNLAEEVKQLKAGQARQGKEIRNFTEEVTVFPSELDALRAAVNKKLIECCGGKNSGAYKDKGLRSKIYSDIWREVKRQYGLIDDRGRQLKYSFFKRKDFKGALETINEYELPIALSNEVVEANELAELEGMED